MKLSLKFFLIAYVIVLLSLGTAGMFIINTASDTVWNSKSERVKSASDYAVGGFLSFADISEDVSDENVRENIVTRIKLNSDNCISDIEIVPLEKAHTDFLALQDNFGFSRYFRDGGTLIMENVCRVSVGSETYFVCVYADFSYEESYSTQLWNVYFIIILLLALFGGSLLYLSARRISRPLETLALTASDIASGDYGKTVSVRSDCDEISNLADSFNVMSLSVKESMDNRNAFVAGFTHEIKTPMTSIIGYSQMLNSYDLDPSEIKQASQSILNEAKRLENLSQQMLRMYVLDSEDVKLSAVNLKSIEKQLADTLEFPSKKYSVPCSIDFDDIEVTANSELLLSLLSNLADNAFKASEKNQPVRIFTKHAGSEVTVFVRDSGRGIAKENIPNITEPFYREDKARSRELGGAGLGLSVCRKIAELHGTQLSFDSEKGKGTTVSFKLKTGGEHNE